MKTKFLAVLFSYLFSGIISQSQEVKTVSSPNGVVMVNFILNNDDKAYYEAFYNNQYILAMSNLGIDLKETNFKNDIISLDTNLEIVSTKTSSKNEIWQLVWGDSKFITDNHNQLTVHLKQKSEKALEFKIVFKVYYDGFGFKYEFPNQPNLSHFTIVNEQTGFQLTSDIKAFWIPGDYDTNEYQPSITKLSEVNPKAVAEATPEIFTRNVISDNAVQTPLMLKTNNGLYINIHEAVW